MKTNNNVQKAILSAIVILTGIAILSGSTKAQGFWSIRNDNPLAMKTNDNSTLNSNDNYEIDLAANSFDYMELMEIEEETPLKVEEWMVKDFISEKEKPADKSNDKLATEKMKPANETTAINKQEKIYSTKTFVYKELEDPELKFEAWMFDRNHWKVK